jgi:hypothetical protein
VGLCASRLRFGFPPVIPPTRNPPIGLGNRLQPNWDEGPTQLGPQNLVNEAIFM